MTVKNRGKGEPIKAIRPNNSLVLHLLSGPLEAAQTPPDSRHTRKRRGINGYGWAASCPLLEGNTVVLLGGLQVGCTVECREKESLQLLAQQSHLQRWRRRSWEAETGGISMVSVERIREWSSASNRFKRSRFHVGPPGVVSRLRWVSKRVYLFP